MMPPFAWALPILMISVQATTEYHCIDFPIENQCVIEQMSYHPGQKITFPDGYQHLRIGFAKSLNGLESNITTMDNTLYEAMHRPAIVEMTNVGMQRLIVPTKLLLGNFADNAIFSLEVDRTETYKITFLDLDNNQLPNINNISALINLETIHLRGNAIEAIDRSVFAPLIKLKRLYLRYNQFSTLPWTVLPSTLVHLDCYLGSLESVDFRNVSLPALEYLNLEKNDITALNVTQLLHAAPKLKEAYLSYNPIHSDQLDEILRVLKERNITHNDGDQYEYCFDDDQYVDGECVKQVAHVSKWKAALLTVISVMVGVLVVVILYWVFKQINR
ncbi:uncharacterized protein LOC131678756 [Topomyia yanbarensis]|uniref:uncharacterized protein LOC131678756 n=1 Tax=Topomyia yanbarensis TaxID=2498891 RepID=UPI00273A7B23|nr:uncharacterized protein LOC131678756 [Topomyia yanbarensis]